MAPGCISNLGPNWEDLKNRTLSPKREPTPKKHANYLTDLHQKREKMQSIIGSSLKERVNYEVDKTLASSKLSQA